MNHKSTRRTFLGATIVSSMALGVPAAVTARRTDPLWPRRGDETIIGQGEYQFRVNHRLVQLPDRFHWQHTHNVTLDSAGNVYVIHEGDAQKKDHPSIFVFDPKGKFIRAFGGQFQGGGHGIDVRKEGNQEFLYVTAYQQVKAFSKMTLTGETVWYKRAPVESGVYAKGEATSTKRGWHRKGFMPTNFAFLDNGGFLLADGYGSYYIHEFDEDANWVRCFGGPGEEKGKFNLSHGLWVDDRPGRENPTLVVTDRNRNSMQRLTLDGKHIETLDGFAKPCTIDVWKNLMVVSEYNATLTLLDEQNQIVVRLNEGVKRAQQIKNLQRKPKQWQDGHFMAPHDACFDADGNIFVAERIPSGRITKLTRVT